ncbi:hypothetical protein A3765_04200 [Oleiphilus sp. HI0130]|nr:hypothetical protein A3765_04200 [Oleiphilus sp. HI0130]
MKIKRWIMPLQLLIASSTVLAESPKPIWYGIYSTDSIIGKNCKIESAEYISNWRYGWAADYKDDPFKNFINSLSQQIEMDITKSAQDAKFNAIVAYKEDLDFSFDSNLEQSKTYRMNGKIYYGDGLAYVKATGMAVKAKCK